MTNEYDILVVGGGINGTAIARTASAAASACCSSREAISRSGRTSRPQARARGATRARDHAAHRAAHRPPARIRRAARAVDAALAGRAAGPVRVAVAEVSPIGTAGSMMPRRVVLNAVDAAQPGAEIRTRTALRSASREPEVWRAVLDTRRDGHQPVPRRHDGAAGRAPR